jgi:tetratricopeptide (TPR) repeat protein
MYLLQLSRLTIIIASLLAGFIGGVVFAVYKVPSITSQIAYVGQQDSDQAYVAQHLPHLVETVKADPNDVDAWLQLADWYYRFQDYPKSIEAYQKLIALVDNKADMYIELGIVYRRDNQFEESIQSFEKAIEHDQNNIQARFNIGVVRYHDLNDEPGAIAIWEKVSALQPDFKVSDGQTIQQLLGKLKRLN